jgi:hypothetical protein
MRTPPAERMIMIRWTSSMPVAVTVKCPSLLSHQLPSSPDFGQYYNYKHIMSQYGALAGSPWDDNCEDDDEMDLFEVGGGDSKMSSPSTSKVVSGPPAFPPSRLPLPRALAKASKPLPLQSSPHMAPVLVPPWLDHPQPLPKP